MPRSRYKDGTKNEGITSLVKKFFGKLGWGGIGEKLRQERQQMKMAFGVIPTFTYPKHIGGDRERINRYKKEMGIPLPSGNILKDLGKAWAHANLKGGEPGEKWKRYKKWMDMEKFETANRRKFANGGSSGELGDLLVRLRNVVEGSGMYSNFSQQNRKSLQIALTSRINVLLGN